MGLDTTEHAFRVSDRVRLKSVISATETNWNFAWSKFRYDTLQIANNKGADQTTWMLKKKKKLKIEIPVQ